jgi:hypothetical protein
VYARAVTRSRAILVSLLVCGWSGCEAKPAEGDAGETETGETEPGEFEELVDHELWTWAEADEDPLAAHRPADVNCGIAGWYLEFEKLEVDTNYCNYLALRQPALVPIEQGRGVQLGLYHFNLTAPEPAVAHVAVLVDGQILWEAEIDIPGSAAVHRHEFAAPFSAPAGAEVVFHLHNHGQNTWALEGISVEQ